MAYINDLFRANCNKNGVVVDKKGNVFKTPDELNDYIILQCELHIEDRGIREFSLPDLASDLCELEMDDIDTTVKKMMDYLDSVQSPTPTLTLLKHLFRQGMEKIQSIIAIAREKLSKR